MTTPTTHAELEQFLFAVSVREGPTIEYHVEVSVEETYQDVETWPAVVAGRDESGEPDLDFDWQSIPESLADQLQASLNSDAECASADRYTAWAEGGWANA